eukprot:6183907-Pyramimonas_sp.AAC.1
MELYMGPSRGQEVLSVMMCHVRVLDRCVDPSGGEYDAIIPPAVIADTTTKSLRETVDKRLHDAHALRCLGARDGALEVGFASVLCIGTFATFLEHENPAQACQEDVQSRAA